jgi:phosphate transport system substrate-binding protein
VIGGDVPVVNIPGIRPGQLILDGPTLANIFLGKIAKWNDPALTRLNPGVALPDLAIVVVHRSDGSGTTFIFANYLSKVSPEWNDKVGAATSVDWPTGIGAKGNEGVAGNVAQTRGAIGYVEYAYATQNRLAHTRMVNRDGKIVAPSLQSFQAAAAGADWAGTPGFGVVLTNQAGANAWPMAGATFILMYKQPGDVAASNTALKFFKWAYANGDALATGLHYVPMPDNVVQQVEGSWKQVQGWPGS